MEVSGVVSLALDPSAANPARPGPWNRDTLARFYLALAFVLGLLRFVALGAPSLWLDEALTLADASRDGGVNPFGYWVFEHLYLFAPGRPDEFWMRLPAAVFGLGATLATAWALGPFVGRLPAALAAFFVGSSAWQLYWAQNARFYTLAQFLTLVGGGVLLRGLYGGSTRKVAFALLLLVLAALTHPSAVFLIGPILCIPWIARWIDWIPEEGSRSRAWNLFSMAGLTALVLGSGWVLRAWMKWEARQGIGSPVHFAKTAGYLLTPTFGLAFLAGAWIARARRRSFCVLVSTVLALVAATLASFLVRVSAQYVFVLQPWMAACAGMALAPEGEDGRASRTPRAALLGLLALLVALPGLVETGLYFTVRHGDRPRWREAYQYVFEHRGPRDLVLGMEAPVAEYYLNPTSTALREWSRATWLDDFRSRLPLDWARYERRTWFVVNRTQFDDWTSQEHSPEHRRECERILREECQLVRSFTIPLTPRDLDVFVYVTREPGGAQE